MIKVVGIGGCGGNIINHMIASGVIDVEFIVMNTDKVALSHSNAPLKLFLGENTKGYLEGNSPEVGARAARTSIEEITSMLKDADMVIVIAGMGGTIGTGASSIIAQTAKSQNIFTIGIVTMPFTFEGKKKVLYAEKGIATLRTTVDDLIIISCDAIKNKWIEEKSITNAFHEVDEVIKQAVLRVSTLVNKQGISRQISS